MFKDVGPHVKENQINKLKSKVKAITYLSPICLMAFLIFVLVGMTNDNTIAIYSLEWWIFGILILGLSFMFLTSFQKIPKIEIINDVIHYNSEGTREKFKIGEITKIEKVNSKISGWYSFRGGLQIHTKKEKLIFPYHIYNNESKMLQLIHQSHEILIEQISEFKLSNLFFLKYFYRNSYSFFLIPIFGFIFLLKNKESNNIGTIVILAIVVLLLIAVFKSFKFLKIENGYLNYINPILMQNCKYDIKSIKHANSELITTGRGGVKNLTIELVDRRIVTLNGGLNSQKSIDEIAHELNTRSKFTGS